MRKTTWTAHPRLSVQARLQWDSVREKQVLLMPEGVLVLNATAAAILAMCDGHRDVSTIAADLSAQYNHVVEEEVLTFLNRLIQRKVIECDDGEE